jgi:pimeloyl-ACP methyl ester carboxylesterase
MTHDAPVIESCDIGGVDIQYLSYGGDGPALLLLHATGFLPWLWHPVSRRLCGSYRVIAPYFCDHRHAEPEEGGLSWEVLAHDLAALCRALNIDSPFMAGHSMGATVMTLAAAITDLKPRGMVLIEPIYLPRQIYAMSMTVDQHPLASRSIKRRNQWAHHEEARQYLRSKPLFARWDDEALDLYLRHGMVSGDGGGLTLACHPRREASLFMGGGHRDPWPLLPDVDCPVLLVEGQDSENRHFIDLKDAAFRFPRGAYRLVEEAGHLIPMEKPGEVAALINEFFSASCS